MSYQQADDWTKSYLKHRLFAGFGYFNEQIHEHWVNEPVWNVGALNNCLEIVEYVQFVHLIVLQTIIDFFKVLLDMLRFDVATYFLRWNKLKRQFFSEKLDINCRFLNVFVPNYWFYCRIWVVVE